jgi:hypothetical protein
MLINVFSLHRTGSTWWAHYIKNQYPGSKIYNEIFNQLWYFTINENGSFTWHNEYSDGCFWRAPNASCTEIVHNYRELATKDNLRFDRWLKFLELSTDTIICHTHLSPLQDDKYLTELCKIGNKNYYVYRENILEKIASFVILEHTGEYTVFTKDRANINVKFTYPIINMKSTEWKIYEILHANEFIENKLFNYERIKYEFMPFNETIEGMPLKQNVSAFDRLCIIDQELIKQIYTRTKNGR